MNKNRWVVAATFAWCVAGSVALAVYSGRPTDAAQVTSYTDLIPADSLPKASTPQKSLGGAKRSTVASKPLPVPAKIVWNTSFEAAMKQARAQGKPVMIDFYTDWCEWCKQLDKTVYTNKEVRAESTKWIVVKVNAEKRADLAQTYGVTGFPTVVFLHDDGKPVDLIDGFQPAPDFLTSMRNAYMKWMPTPV